MGKICFDTSHPLVFADKNGGICGTCGGKVITKEQ